MRPASAIGSSPCLSPAPPFAFPAGRCRACSVLAAGLALALSAQAQTQGGPADADQAQDLDKILVVSQRAQRVSNGATNLDLAIKDTPQSISVISREQMDAFGANTLNDALRLATGIQVEEWETNRTNYLSRGFEIENTQIDGIGLPNGWGIVTGAMDSYGYDKIEVIRGANGLLTGVGNAAGTINYVRKRPTNDEQGSVGISYGSWNTRREQVDYSSPITTDGTWAVRVVAAHEDGGSYLRDYDKERTFLYGVVDGQIGENGTLTAGYSWQQANSTGNMWGALTFNTIGGGQIGWPRSASTTQDWTYWNTNNQTGFVEYAQQLSPDWKLKVAYNYRRSTEDDQLFFAYTTTGLDPVTGEGLNGYPYKGRDKVTANLGTVEAQRDLRAVRPPAGGDAGLQPGPERKRWALLVGAVRLRGRCPGSPMPAMSCPSRSGPRRSRRIRSTSTSSAPTAPRTSR